MISVRFFDRKASVHHGGRDIAVAPVFNIKVIAVYREEFYTTKYKQRISAKFRPTQEFLQTFLKRTGSDLCARTILKWEATSLATVRLPDSPQ
jgi:hypothetical protein